MKECRDSFIFIVLLNLNEQLANARLVQRAVNEADLSSQPHHRRSNSCFGLIRLGERFGQDRLEAACTRALKFDACSYKRIKAILESGWIGSRYSSPRLPHLPGARILRLAAEWRIIARVPRIRMLQGERNRDFVLTREQEKLYLEIAPQPLKDAALLLLETGLRVGELVALEREDIHLERTNGAKFGYLRVRSGKSKNAKRTISLTARVSEALRHRLSASDSRWVFPGEGKANDVAFLSTSLDGQHSRVRAALGLPKDFVLHSMRHTFLTRLGEAGVDAFTIMRIAGHSSVTVSQKYVHPSTEAMERAFERLEKSHTSDLEISLPATVSATLTETVSDSIM